jgi:hypothetical protein
MKLYAFDTEDDGRGNFIQGGAYDGDRFARPERRYAYEVLRAHFAPLSSDALVTATRVFPARMRADLQRALDRTGPEHTPADCTTAIFETVAFSHCCRAGWSLLRPHYKRSTSR